MRGRIRFTLEFAPRESDVVGRVLGSGLRAHGGWPRIGSVRRGSGLTTRRSGLTIERQTRKCLACQDSAKCESPSRRPLNGWEAIRSSLENELNEITIDAGVEVVEVVIAGSWAYARGHYRISTLPQAGGRGAVTTGSWLDILKRQADGSWRIARSAWSNHGTEYKGSNPISKREDGAKWRLTEVHEPRLTK